MFTIPFGKPEQQCNKVSRRDALTVGGTRLLGGLSLPALLNLEANAASGRKARVKSCIFIMLEGGPSHIDMWDLKPNAPAEIRGPFNPISTSVPGTQIGEILPLCSKIVDKFAILRSHSHRDNAHQTGRHWVMTGYPPNFPDGQAKGIPFNEHYPSLGSIISRELGHRELCHRISRSLNRWDLAALDFTVPTMHPLRSKTIRWTLPLRCGT